jgi:glycosyltransferase involved in cell wall biosynthesis
VRVLLAPDLSAPTGGNRYDAELLARGVVDRVVGSLEEVPAGAAVLLDGLVASARPDVLAAHRGRVRLVLLVHLLRADDVPPEPVLADEVRSLRLVDAVVVPSRSAARRVLEVSGVEAVVAEPGTAPVRPSVARGAHRVLSVGTVGARKGQRLLAEAVARLGDPWTVRCAGTVEEGFSVAGTTLLGPLDDAALQAEWDRADLHALLSEAEPYGMAVAEGLVRGVPSLVADRGELPDLVGHAGIVVERDVDAVCAALERWAASPGLRNACRRAAAARELPTWDDTARTVTDVLEAP